MCRLNVSIQKISKRVWDEYFGMNPRITTQHVRIYDCCAEPRRVTPVYNISFFSIPVPSLGGQLIVSEKKKIRPVAAVGTDYIN